jgi:glycosyltransferase involved in cell wall biosynthesis
MRLLLFNYEFPPVGGGGGWVTYFLAREYARIGHEVLVLTSAYDGLPRREMHEGFTVERVPAWRRSPNVAQVHEMLSYAVSSTWAGMRRSRELRPDVVQVFFGIPSGLGAYVLRQRYGIPYVVFLGGRDVPRPNPDPPHYRYLYSALRPAIRAIWRSAHSVVACSEGLRELARETDPGVPFRVIPDGIDLERFRPCERASRSVVRVLSIGRLIPRKGFDTLLRASALLRTMQVSAFEVEIVGDGPERDALENLARALGVADLVRFAGAVPYDGLPSRYSEADIFALPSRAEGMPLVVLEAMATGLPVVATQVQGVVELVADGVNGWQVSVGDAAGLASRLAALISDPERRRVFGARSVDRVRPYAWPNVAAAYLRLLEAAAKERALR